MTAARRRLQTPTGTTVWAVVTATGQRHMYDTETEANTKKTQMSEPAFVYPLIVDTEEAS